MHYFKRQIFLLLLLLLLVACTSNHKNNSFSEKDYAFAKSYEISTLTIYQNEEHKLAKEDFLKNQNNPDYVYALTKNDIFNLIGAPQLTKVEQNSEIWQYRQATCIFNVIWRNSKLVYLKSYNQNKKDINPVTCFFNIVQGSTDAL